MFEAILLWILFNAIVVVAAKWDWPDDRKSDAENPYPTYLLG